MATNEFFENPQASGINEVRNSWGWLLTLGILLMLLGAVCVIANITATFATVLMFGWLLLFGGVASLIQAFRVHTWSGFFMYLMGALLRMFTGYVLIRYPLSGAVTLTLVLASFLIVGGTFRMIGSSMLRFPRWGWAVFSGIVSLGLGVLLLIELPVASLWFIGFAIGVEMIAEGASLAAFAAAIHSMPKLGRLEMRTA